MYFEHFLATYMQNVDEASPSIILAGLALLMKMRITLGLCGIFLLKFVYYCILTLSNRWYVKMLITLSRVVHSVQNFFTYIF